MNRVGRVGAGLLALALLAASRARAQEEVDVAALAAKALDAKVENVLDPEIFERIGRVQTRLALNALIECCERARDDRRPAAFLALRHFAGSEELRGSALAYLAKNALGEHRARVRHSQLAPPVAVA